MLALLLVLRVRGEAGVVPGHRVRAVVARASAGNLHAMALPAVAMAFPLFCFYTRFLRGDLVDQMQGEDYVTTARAKGLGPWQVLLRHAFRNSSFGLITIVGLNLSGLIGGTVIIEQIFVAAGDRPAAPAGASTPATSSWCRPCVLVFAVITVLANLMADVLYAVLDPRIRYGSH